MSEGANKLVSDAKRCGDNCFEVVILFLISFQIHTGMQHVNIYMTQPIGHPLSDPTIADKLKDTGYSTHMVGKWHIGFYKKEYTPLYRGFDSFYGKLSLMINHFWPIPSKE